MRKLDPKWAIAGALVLAVLVIGGIWRLTGSQESEQPQAQQAPVPGSAAPAPQSQSPSSSSQQPSQQAAPWAPGTRDNGQGFRDARKDQAQWMPIAQGFAREFTNSSPGWLDRLRPLVTQQLADKMGTVRPDAIPPGKLQSTDMIAVTEVGAMVGATYDSGLRIQIQIYSDGQGWKVSGYDEAG